jgi:large subunit ribosomal protein L13
MMARGGLSPQGIEGEWYIVDAEGKTLGRLASQVASVLRGKHKPTYSPLLDYLIFWIVLFSGKLSLTLLKKCQSSFFHIF